jgi:hypothetical protein
MEWYDWVCSVVWWCAGRLSAGNKKETFCNIHVTWGSNARAVTALLLGSNGRADLGWCAVKPDHDVEYGCGSTVSGAVQGGVVLQGCQLWQLLDRSECAAWLWQHRQQLCWQRWQNNGNNLGTAATAANVAAAAAAAAASTLIYIRSPGAEVTGKGKGKGVCSFDQFVVWCDQRRLEWAGVAQMSFCYRCNMNE